MICVLQAIGRIDDRSLFVKLVYLFSLKNNIQGGERSGEDGEGQEYGALLEYRKVIVELFVHM